MTATRYKLTGKLRSQAGLEDPGAKIVSAFLVSNVPNGDVLIDTDAGIIQFAPMKLTVAADGSFTQDNILATDNDPADISHENLLYQVVVMFENPIDRQTKTWSSAWFNLTGDTDLSETGSAVFLPASATAALQAAVDALIADMAGKADIDNPDFTGTPTVPDIVGGADPGQIANKAYVDAAVAAGTGTAVDFMDPPVSSGFDQSQINTRLAAMSAAGGGTLLFRGDYTTNGSITIPDNVVMAATSPGSASIHVTQTTGQGITGTKAAGVTFTGSITIGAANLTSSASTFNASMVGCWVKVPGAGYGGRDLNAKIKTYNSTTSVTLDRNAVASAAGVAGCVVAQGNVNIGIKGIRVWGENTTGAPSGTIGHPSVNLLTFTYSKNLVIEDCELDHGWSMAMQLKGCCNVSVHHNYVHEVGRDGIDIAQNIDPGHHISVTANTVRNAGDDKIIVGWGSANDQTGGRTESVVIAGNNLSGDQTASTFDLGRGIVIAGAFGFVVTGNVVTDTSGPGIWCREMVGGSGNINPATGVVWHAEAGLIVGNTILRAGQNKAVQDATLLADVGPSPCSGIHVTSSDNVLVKDNVIRYSYYVDVWVAADCTNVWAPDNNVVDSNGNLFDRTELVATVVATANVATLSQSAPPTIDGRTIQRGDLILLTAQTDPTQNGLWFAPPASPDTTRAQTLGVAWVRALTMPIGLGVRRKSVKVLGGTTYAGTIWSLTTGLTSVVVGTSAQTWTQDTVSTGGGTTAAFYEQVMGMVGNGDSIMMAGADATSSWATMATNLGLTVGFVNNGKSGTTTSEMALRAGAFDVGLTGPGSITSGAAITVVPTTGTYQNTAMSGANALTGILTTGAGVNIPGTLTHDAATPPVWTFDAAGSSSYTLTAPLTFHCTDNDSRRDWFQMVEAGTNNYGSPANDVDYSVAIRDMDLMVRYFRRRGDVVINGLHIRPVDNWAQVAARASYIATMNARHPTRYHDEHAYLVQWALPQLGLTPTAADCRDLMLNRVPSSSLESDGTHPEHTIGYPVWRRGLEQFIRTHYPHIAVGKQPYVAPAAPVVALSAAGASSLSVTWGAVTGAIGYRVRYRRTGTTTWLQGQHTTGTSAVVVDPVSGDLWSGTEYEIEVTAVNEAGGGVPGILIASTTGTAPVILTSESFSGAAGNISGSSTDAAAGGTPMPHVVTTANNVRNGSGQLNQSTGTQSVDVVDTGSPDQRVRTRVNGTPATLNTFVILRYTDINNFYKIMATSLGHLQVWKVVAGTGTQIATQVDAVFPPGVPFDLTGKITGSEIRAIVNGQTLVKITDTSLTTGNKHGHGSAAPTVLDSILWMDK